MGHFDRGGSDIVLLLHRRNRIAICIRSTNLKRDGAYPRTAARSGTISLVWSFA